jgi:hypothetical protein
MHTIQTTSHVGPDGMLKLSVPVGIVDADVQVTVVVEPMASAQPLSGADREEWRQFVAETAGSIQDPTFFRHEQGEYETREPM